MKKIISIALALLMVAVMLPVMAMAADDTELPEVQNGVIKLTNNVTLSKMTEINGNITLDLNGFTISGKGTVLDLYGNIEIKDSSEGGKGKIVSTERTTPPDKLPNSNGIWINDNTSVTINSGTIESKTWGVVVAGVNASLTMNGGTIINGITGNGSNNDNGDPVYAPTTITINGGEIKGDDVGIYHPQVGTLTITNGEISGKSGIEMRAGTLNVTGGNVRSTADRLDVKANGGGPTTEGAALAIAQHTTKRPITVNISGGNFNGPAALNEANPQGNHEDATKNVGVVVNGGNFEGMVCKAEPKDGSSLGVMGGTFNTNVIDYVHASPTVKDNNGKYHVGNTAKNVVENAESGSFEVLAAGAGEALNVKPGVTIVNNSNTTIKVNGNEVPNGKSYTVPGAPIFIYTPTEDTPKANDQKNPGTGANDLVGVAAAMAVVSLLGAAAVIRKK